MKAINFWNGNKSSVRQEHELNILKALLKSTEGCLQKCRILDDRTDYPNAQDEGAIFQKGADILVTVSGNTKFKVGSYIEVSHPLANGILGKRVLIIRKGDRDKFRSIGEEQLKTLRSGIPATWADADLFRYNGYKVVEKGTFEDIFLRLKGDQCDYIALGINEVTPIYNEMADPIGGLCIEKDLMLSYPMPLVFYVHPGKPELAKRVEIGLKHLKNSGEYQRLFNLFYGECFELHNAKQRKIFELKNPQL